MIVTIRDVTSQNLQEQKREELHLAGIALAELSPDELRLMTIEDRINLLKEDILKCTKDLLKFDVIEVRLLDRKTRKLELLMSVGLKEEAVNRVLYAKNGIKRSPPDLSLRRNKVICVMTFRKIPSISKGV